ncbi:MAG: SCO family protein [Calditrichaeota bacterium]|nr:SCO family protein [Calditrichota bacterium]
MRFILICCFLLIFNCEKKEEAYTGKQLADKERPLAELSIYNLPSEWETQRNQTMQLSKLRGNIVVIVMIYTSCKAACPRLVADMRSIESKLSDSILKKTKLVLVSIDPETDTVDRLAEFARENEMDADHWLFLRSTEANTREFANVLAVKYKQISPMDFSHSNIISVFDQEGVLVHQQEGLGVDNQETINKIIELSSN